MTDWVLLWAVLVTAGVVSQGLSILLYRPRVLQRQKPSEADLQRVAREAAEHARRQVAEALEDEEPKPRRQATWASGVRSSRRREGEES